MTSKLDDIDLAILGSLRENAKASIKDVAKKIGVHPNTLLQRLKKLENNGIITKYVAEVDYSKVGYDLHVIIMMKVRRGRAGDKEQMKELLRIKELEAVYATTGNWDLISVARVKNREHLLEVIQRIGKNPLITKTTSHLVLFAYKNPYQFNPFIEEI